MGRYTEIDGHAVKSGQDMLAFIAATGLDEKGQVWLNDLVTNMCTQLQGHSADECRIALAALALFSEQLTDALDTVIDRG